MTMHQERHSTATSSSRSSSDEPFPLKYNNDSKLMDCFSIAARNNEDTTFRERIQTDMVVSALDEITKMNQTTTTEEVGSQTMHTLMEAIILELKVLKDLHLHLDDDDDADDQEKIFQHDFVPLKDMHNDDDGDESTRSWPYDETFSAIETLENDYDVDVDAVAFQLEVNAWKGLNIDLDDSGKYSRDLMLSNISMLVELLETSATPELDRCIFRKAIKLEINALKNLYLKRTTVHHYPNSTTYRTSEKSLNEKSTICDDGCDDNDAATDSTYYSSVFSSLNSLVSSSLMISRKKMKISDREWFHRCFGWLTRSSRKKEWRRTFQGPVRNGRTMEMIFYDNTQSDSCSF
jgi:hypothetical protein